MICSDHPEEGEVKVCDKCVDEVFEKLRPFARTAYDRLRRRVGPRALMTLIEENAEGLQDDLDLELLRVQVRNAKLEGWSNEEVINLFNDGMLLDLDTVSPRLN